MAVYNSRDVCPVRWAQYIQEVDPGNPLSPLRPAPNLHILAEGDSWFHMGGNKGMGKVRNLVDTFSFKNKKAVIANVGMSGDILVHMNTSMKYGSVKDAFKYRKWDLILLSAGGNDLIDAVDIKSKYLIDGKPISLLKSNKSGIQATDFIDLDNLDIFLRHIKKCFEQLIVMRDGSINKDVPIVAHTYDYPTPNNALAKYPLIRDRGPWLYKALENKIDQKYWNGISDFLFSKFADFLLSLSLPYLFVCDTTGTLNRAISGATSNSNDWLNEIHPNSDGYKKLGKVISKYISDKKLV